MTTLFKNQAFRSFYDDGGSTFTDIEFQRCHFVSSAISMTRTPRCRSLVRNIKFVNCEVQGCALETAIVEDVVVENLKTHGLFQTWGAVFKHVVLRGKIGRIMISPAVATGMAEPEEQRTFDQVNAAYYATVDWALDIREAEFAEGELQRVPAHLIRRDPATQIVIKREKALLGAWQNLDLSKTHWATSIEFFLDRGDQDVVLVAPKRHQKYRQLLDGLKMLRDAGVAEPD
jgi:hypothetical protein